MMYVIVILIGVMLLLYFGGRWLAHELREGGKLLRKVLVHATGGQTPEKLIRETHLAFDQRGLGPPDLVAVPSEADKVYGALRRHLIDRVPEPELPAALGTVVALNIDFALAYLRAVVAPAGQPAREQIEFIAFDDIRDIQPLTATPHSALITPGETVLELQTRTGTGPYHLPVDPAWGLTPVEFAEHLRAMIRERRRPAGGTVILR